MKLSVYVKMYILDLLLDRITLTAYVDAVYCYRPSSVVCLSVCRFVTLVSPAKTAEPMEMPDAVWVVDLGVDPRKYVSLLGGVHTVAIWRISLSRPCAEAMRPVVKLL